jgi:hypothetical protein
MNTTIIKFIQMIRVLDFVDNIYENAIRYIQRENTNKDEVRDLIKQYFHIQKICKNKLHYFTDEMCNDAEAIFSFIFISIVVHLKSDLSNWSKFKTQLQTNISNEMEEIKASITEYAYLSKYNQFRDAIQLLEIFLFTYPNLQDFEITTDAKIYLNVVTPQIKAN